MITEIPCTKRALLIFVGKSGVVNISLSFPPKKDEGVTEREILQIIYICCYIHRIMSGRWVLFPFALMVLSDRSG